MLYSPHNLITGFVECIGCSRSFLWIGVGVLQALWRSELPSLAGRFLGFSGSGVLRALGSSLPGSPYYMLVH